MLEDMITCFVAIDVIDRFETIQIKVIDDDGFVRAKPIRHQCDIFQQVPSVSQSGKFIRNRKPAQRVLLFL